MNSFSVVHSSARSSPGVPRVATGIVAALLMLLSAFSFVTVRAAPPPGDPAELLAEAKNQLQRRQTAEAVRGLRSILRDHVRSEHVREATRLLAEHGYGLEFHVVFDAQKAIEKFQVRLPDIVHETHRIRGELEAFFKQVYPRHQSPYLEIVLFDSRRKYKTKHNKAGRRSVVERLPSARGKPTDARVRIGVFYDVRISNRKDILQALHVSLARAMASAMHASNLKQPLPASLESGVADYLAARLFPERYYSTRRSPEEILQGYARRGLSPLVKLNSFESHLFDGGPRSKAGPGLERRWVGLSYAIVDVLIRAEFGKKGKSKDAKPAPRNEAFQGFLRDFATEVPGRDKQPKGKAPKGKGRARASRKRFETLLRNHFDLGLTELHKAYVDHVQGYVIGESSDQGLEEL
jgi:hypothetical protein